jgi:hypothetical protein
LMVSPFTLGTMEFGNKVDQTEAARLFSRTIDAGGHRCRHGKCVRRGSERDMGGIESARWVEALSLAWVVYSHRTGKTHHAFKLVGK